MVNRQLLKYIREQIAHGMDVNTLRGILAQEGWAQQDVEDAISQVYSKSQDHNKNQHDHKALPVAILAVVVLILIAGIFLVVFTRSPDIENSPDPIPTIENGNNQITGWAVCAQEEDSLEKDKCYRELARDDFDCSSIVNEMEQRFCYRSSEAVILEQYSQA